MKILKYTAIILLSFFLLLVGAGWWIFHPEKPDPTCFEQKEALVKIGNTVLAIPRKFGLILEPPIGKFLPRDKATFELCQRIGDSPVVVRSIAFGEKYPIGLRYSELFLSKKPQQIKGLQPSTHKPQFPSIRSYFYEYDDEIILSFIVDTQESNHSPQQKLDYLLNEIQHWKKRADEILAQQINIKGEKK